MAPNPLRSVILADLLSASLAALGTSDRTSQEVQTYYDVISKMPWRTEHSGSIVAVGPLAVAKGETVEELHRKTVTIGKLTAVVPTRMVTINSHFTEAPNLYDGLPREAKVHYLLTLLAEDPWQKITTDGLSINDCRGQ